MSNRGSPDPESLKESIKEGHPGISPEWIIEESKQMFTKEMGFDPTDHLISQQMANAVSVVGLRMFILGHERGFDLCKGRLQAKSPEKGGKH